MSIEEKIFTGTQDQDQELKFSGVKVTGGPVLKALKSRKFLDASIDGNKKLQFFQWKTTGHEEIKKISDG